MIEETNRKNHLLLVQLRWLAVVGQIVTILLVQFGLGIDLPLAQMFAVVAVLAGTNLASYVRRRGRTTVPDAELFLELLLDVAALTVQLFLSGGASNPFISLYLLQVILGAVLLRRHWAWALVALTCGCFIWLTTSYRPIAIPHAHGGDFLNLNVQGMFVCFALAAGLIVFFVTRVHDNLRQRDANLAALRQQAAEHDHIIRLGLLASGAAHELGTPLATMSVIVDDWRSLPGSSSDSSFQQELADMQAQLDRCKSIVSGILVSSGDARAEGTLRTTLASFLDETIEEWRSGRPVKMVDYSRDFDTDPAIIADRAFKQVIFNLLDNAFEASPAWVGVEIARSKDCLHVEVADAGPGFSSEMLDQFGQPYRSTKGKPGGGLGLFLVVNVIRKLGGTVTARNRSGGGATVAFDLPLSAIAVGGSDGC